MKNIRPLGWVIIAFNIYFVFAFARGASEIGQDDLALGFYGFFSLIIWAVINLVLYVIYRVTGNQNKRSCPACNSRVKTGLTKCPKCSFDFLKLASGQEVTEVVSQALDKPALYPKSSPIDWKVTGGALVGIAVIILISNLFSSTDSPSGNNSNSGSSNSNYIQESEDSSWIPKGFSAYSQDQNIAWRWLKNSEFECSYGDSCWGLMVISKQGCPNGLYAELSLLDKNRVQVGYTNDTLSAAQPLQKSKMIFESFEEAAETGQLSKISCY
jgi:hypothetical protein